MLIFEEMKPAEAIQEWLDGKNLQVKRQDECGNEEVIPFEELLEGCRFYVYTKGMSQFLSERKNEYQKQYNRAYEQEQRARKFLENEPNREDVKCDLNEVIKLQDKYHALIDFINELQEFQ